MCFECVRMHRYGRNCSGDEMTTNLLVNKSKLSTFELKIFSLKSFIVLHLLLGLLYYFLFEHGRLFSCREKPIVELFHPNFYFPHAKYIQSILYIESIEQKLLI